MSTYKLYYWPVPFRGNFIQLLLEHAGADYELASNEETMALKNLPANTQSTPGMAPPVLHDAKNDLYLTQMPAIVFYLANQLGYCPTSNSINALALKTVLDCNDVLSDITNANGASMWDYPQWQVFRTQRLTKWWSIFEQMGKSHGLNINQGFYLGTQEASYADIAVTSLFSTMMRCLPSLQESFINSAPMVANLCTRIEQNPRIQSFILRQSSTLGLLYCGGQIEGSIRKMLEKDENNASN